MKRKHIILILFACFGLILLGAQIRYRSFVADIPVSQILFAIMAFILVKKKVLKGRWTHILLPLSVIFWDIFGHSFDSIFSIKHDWNFLTIGTPNMVLCAAGALYGSLLASALTRQRIAGVALLIFSTIFSSWYMVKGFDYWTHYCSWGNIAGRIKNIKIQNWKQAVYPADTLPIGFYKDKYIVLDFWTAFCGVCFRKFPELDNVNRKYQSNRQVMVWAINLPLANDSSKYERAAEMKQKYTFQNTFADSTAWEVFDISGVPTILVIKNDEVVFKGDIENLKTFLSEEVY